ncbi:unnamed protein product [Pleuronectes platessa]|uniref:Uncharacterized protein n=1 Tax=Pleuronectes platessa TaxID=8262 RepID=A0A9N7VH12_PLEPL|nr:unnamed protein product [Pleuronectes platessa]
MGALMVIFSLQPKQRRKTTGAKQCCHFITCLHNVVLSARVAAQLTNEFGEHRVASDRRFGRRRWIVIVLKSNKELSPATMVCL